MKNDNKTQSDISHEVIQDLREYVNKFLKEFAAKTANAGDFLTMDQLENLFSELDAETRKTYLNMVSDSLSSIDEKEIIKSKKDNTQKEG